MAEGFTSGFLGALQAYNAEAEQKLKKGKLDIDLQDLQLRQQQNAQKVQQDAYQRIMTQTDAAAQGYIDHIGTNFQEGTPVSEGLDRLKQARAQALKAAGMDPDLAEGWAQTVRAAMKQPKTQTAQPGTTILQVDTNGNVTPKYSVPALPSELQRSAEYAAGGNAEQARGLVRGVMEQRAAGSPAYSTGTPVIDDKGQYAGTLVTNRRDGKQMFQGLDGSVGDLPEGYRPTTNSGLNANTANFTAFNKLSQDANQIERSVTQISKYMENVNDTEQGWKLLADQWRTQAKTIFGGNLSEQEIKTAAQNGRLQGLLGQFREDIVGGGVMTEQDAQRVLSALGGDATWTRNRQVVADLLKDIVQNRVADYNSRVMPQFNEQLKTAKRGDLKPKEALTVNEKLFSGAKGGAREDAAVRAARAPARPAPKVGDIRDGYRFDGGDPGEPGSWSKVR